MDFDAQFSSGNQFDADFDSGQSQMNVSFENDAVFNASLDDDESSFDADFENEEPLFADFGVQQTVDTAKVTSVNGMIGDVVLHIPEMVSELENDSGYITGVETLTNLEIDELLT